MATLLNSLTLYPGFTVTDRDTVLDIGCGIGQTCVRVGRVGAGVIALDIDPENLKCAHAGMNGNAVRSFGCIRSDGDPIPLHDGSVTAVIAQEVLEHVPNPRRLVTEMIRVGTADARYLITVPDSLSENLLALVADPSYFQPPNHIHVFDRAEIESILTDAGLEIVSRSFVGFSSSLWWVFTIISSSHHSCNWPSCRGKPTGQEARTHLVRLWEEVWDEFHKNGGSDIVESLLDTLIPKSQVYVAKKRDPSSPDTVPGSAGEDVAKENERLRKENDVLRQNQEALRNKMLRVLQSRSWRYTGPLRRLKAAFLDLLESGGRLRTK
ncbi:MAG: methyltransferase domain-containing protein [Desulfomonilaceae bacterium]|nr:methyltransferase domain-containing protein [Desulfomonilaceae bacterium]